MTLDAIKENLVKVTTDIHLIDSTTLALEAGTPRTENVVLLGAASSIEGFSLTVEQLVDAIKSIVPGRTAEQNVKAFELGVGSI